MLAACDGLQEGQIVVSLDAEGVAQAGLGSANEDTESFVDGWNVMFSRVIVSVGKLRVANSGGDTAASSRAYYVADLAQGEPDIELLESIGAQRWNSVSFSIEAPPNDATVRRFGVTEQDVVMLQDGDYAYWIEGSATKEDRSVSFAWGITNPTDYVDCTTNGDDGPGIEVSKNVTTALDVRFHLQHLFWDKLGTESGRLRFEAVAAMAGADGVVTWASLADQNLAALRDANGGLLTDSAGPVVYDASDATLPREDLQRFISAALSNQPHIGQDGRCVAEPR
ncbi:MAG: hypothetical protein JKY37_03120 [Nannocystaceae bacterium]|nr:hypothetical protein [Nannocystaceae bacterium]